MRSQNLLDRCQMYNFVTKAMFQLVKWNFVSVLFNGSESKRTIQSGLLDFGPYYKKFSFIFQDMSLVPKLYIL